MSLHSRAGVRPETRIKSSNFPRLFAFWRRGVFNEHKHPRARSLDPESISLPLRFLIRILILSSFNHLFTLLYFSLGDTSNDVNCGPLFDRSDFRSSLRRECKESRVSRNSTIVNRNHIAIVDHRTEDKPSLSPAAVCWCAVIIRKLMRTESRGSEKAAAGNLTPEEEEEEDEEARETPRDRPCASYIRVERRAALH